MSLPTLLLSPDAAHAVRLADEAQAAPSGIVSRPLLQVADLRVVLFAFAKGEELSLHTNRRRALVQILEGSCEVFFNGKWQGVSAGELVHLPPHHPHALRSSDSPFLMLLTIGADGIRPAPVQPSMNQTEIPDATHFDVRNISCKVKHELIFKRWSELSVGSHFVLINDHDPVPLYYQFAAQFPGAFAWEYLVRDPNECRVRISRLAKTGAPVPTGACPGTGA